MGRGPTKSNENVYFVARKKAAMYNERLYSREGAAELLGISVSTLADYELGNTKVVPVDRVLWKKLSRIYAVDMAEVLGWIEYISIMGIFQCFCIVMACEQRGRVAFGGEYLILPAAILARLWIPEMIQSVSNVLEMPDEEEDDV